MVPEVGHAIEGWLLVEDVTVSIHYNGAVHKVLDPVWPTSLVQGQVPVSPALHIVVQVLQWRKRNILFSCPMSGTSEKTNPPDSYDISRVNADMQNEWNEGTLISSEIRVKTKDTKHQLQLALVARRQFSGVCAVSVTSKPALQHGGR